MEDLDAELLAVTDGQKRAKRTARGSTSDSDGEFEGIADSDGGDDDDDDMLDDAGGLDDDDDDDDDDEYGLDEDDEDFGTKSSRKKKATKKSRAKKAASKSKSTRRRPRSFEKRSARDKDNTPLSDNDDDEFVYKFDQYGYGDAADQEKLARMNEVDREIILEGRTEARNREYMLWKKRREMTRSEARDRVGEKRSARSSGRSKQSSKSDALQALAEDKRKKSARPVNLDVSDADSEPDPSRRQTTVEAERKEKRRQPEVDTDESGPGLKYTDIVTKDESGGRVTTPLFLRRDALVKLSQQAFFQRAVVGLFCRVRAIGRLDDSYLLCRIVDAVIGSVYEVGDGLVSNWSLVLQAGGRRKTFEIRHTSGSAPSEKEFDDYCRRSLLEDIELPRREDVNKLMKRSKDMIFGRNAVPTDAELKKHVANMELLYPSRVNWTQKFTEAKTELEIKRQDLTAARDRKDTDLVEKLQEEVEKMEKRVAEVQRFEEKYVLKPVKTNAEVFHTLAKRNMALNTTTERLAANRDNLESRGNGTNPFARFDTTGQSYFSIPSRDTKEQPKDEAPLKSYSDWRSLASTWDPSGKRRKVSEYALDSAYDTPLSSLHVFDGDGGGTGHRGGFGLLPAMVDSAYIGQACAKSTLPPGAKILSLEEWSRQRAG